MNLFPRRSGRTPGKLGKLLYTSLAVLGLGIASMPAQASSITIDSAPLIVQPTLPPNIILMLDDSGSMAWDYMPDACYMNGVTCTGTNNGTTPSGNGTDYVSTANNDAMINSNNNGVYYNPTITYSPPYYANGTQYPNATGLTTAWINGFNQSQGTVDLTNYSDNDIDGENGNNDATLYYSYSANGNGPSQNFSQTSISQSRCNSYYSSNNGYGGANWTKTGTSFGTPIGTCTFTYYPTVTYYYFQYSTGAAAGPYTDYYVANTNCGGLTNCVLASDTSGSAAPKGIAAGVNIANWFAYYHTRILMAKSGLTEAFVNLNTTYRMGYGSINNNGASDIQNNSLYTNINSTYIAEAQPFGDGSAGTQKANFWQWITDIQPSNGTRLRYALDAVGQYYETQQPWLSDPTSAASTTNTELACRQSYTILTTDGFWNDSFSPSSTNTGESLADDITGPTITGTNNQSYTYSPAAPYADNSNVSVSTSSYAACSEYVSGTTTSVLQTSGTHANMCQVITSGRHGSTTSYKNPCNSGDTYSSTTQQCTHTATSGSTYNNTLADVAMYYWENDLRPNTNNEVPTNSEDPAFWQHMTTFTMGLGFTPTGISPSGTTVSQIFNWANGGSSISNFSWPQPASNSIYNIADLAHAAVNGHGGFYSATSPQAFASGLQDALTRAASRVGTGSSLAANSTQLESGSVAYQASYWTTAWKGDLQAFSINSSTGAIATTASWSAAANLPSAANRTIYTYNPVSTTYLSFALSSTGTAPALSTAQNTALSATINSVSNENNMINYLRGDSSQDESHNGAYRTRTTPLGDIVDSQPVYVGAPEPDQFYQETFTGSSSFASYASTNASRQGEVYVAANDGMLHAFNASTGAETYAYLPGAVITSGVNGTSALTGLADPNYGSGLAHQYFNDGELTVADAYFNSAWHTVLVSTTGRGLAKAVYALDITNPTSIKFLWERSAGDGLAGSTYIGQMTGQPVIAQTADGTWSVLMGNGYNSAGGQSALLQFNLPDGTLNVHTTTDTTGLAAPAVWSSPAGNGVSTVAYAGDANGDVWSFALNTSTGSTSTATPTSKGTLLYQAEDAKSNAQPITAGLLIGEDPNTGNVWLFFGTGQYLSSSDLTNLNTQTWYGLIVQSTNSTTSPPISSTMTRANLAQRSITGEQAASGTTLAARTITTLASASSLTGMSGWYIDLTSPVSGAQGERMVTSNQFEGNLLLGTTRIPQASDACNPSGTGWIMAVNPFSGTNPTIGFFDTNGDGVINSSDSINGVPAAGIGFTSLPNNPIFVGSSMLTSFDNGTTSSISTSSSTGSLNRVSWRELTTH